MEISLFWLCSFGAASLCGHVEMLYFRAATRWQNTPRHPLQAGLPAPQAGAVQDYGEGAAATAAEFLSLHLSLLLGVHARGCFSKNLQMTKTYPFCLVPEVQGRDYDCSQERRNT